ncbi:MAG: hypothetical protein K2V38_00035, partial [Gemmataceae bacterium]|nr:hypothetical protein [Gemmataceae bacterium]
PPAKVEPPKPGADPAPKRPRVELAMQELAVIRQELFATGQEKLDPAAKERLLARLEQIARLLDPNDLAMNPEPPVKPTFDSAMLQGAWYVSGISENGKAVPLDAKEPVTVIFQGSTVGLPYKETGKADWGQREYSFTADGTKSPKTIDLTRPREPVGGGIYEFTALSKACAACHAIGDRYKIPGSDQLPLCRPALKQAQLGKVEIAGLRLAVSIDGKRPSKFEGAGVIVFELTRTAAKDDTKAQQEKLRADLEQFAAELAKLVATPEQQAELERRLRAVQEAEAAVLARALEIQRADAQFKAAKVQVEVAVAELRRAEVQFEAAKKSLADLKAALAQPKPPAKDGKDGPAFAVHVRTQGAAEKVVTVKHVGGETVLEGLVYAANDVPVKVGAVSVWVVRGKEVLAVDLEAITRKGDRTTNHTLRPGDQLFVQQKAEK